MFKWFSITCDEATTICDKSQYGEASFSEKIKLKLHFLLCKVCALYTKQNSMVTKICQKKTAQNNCLTKEDKQAMKKVLQEKNM